MESVVSDRQMPIATATPVSSSAGECGVKDQVSRSEQRQRGSDGGPRHLALVGATGTGKTELAVAFARAVPGVELLSVDAFAVYRGFDIGTAKPTVAEREGVVWHLLDLLDPAEECSVADTAFWQPGSPRPSAISVEVKMQTAPPRSIAQRRPSPVPMSARYTAKIDRYPGRRGRTNPALPLLSGLDPTCASVPWPWRSALPVRTTATGLPSDRRQQCRTRL